MRGGGSYVVYGVPTRTCTHVQAILQATNSRVGTNQMKCLPSCVIINSILKFSITMKFMLNSRVIINSIIKFSVTMKFML